MSLGPALDLKNNIPWMKLEDTVQNEVSQKEKDRYKMISL